MHSNSEIPGNHAENGEHWLAGLVRAGVKSRVRFLYQSQPRMSDQKPIPKDPAGGVAADSQFQGAWSLDVQALLPDLIWQRFGDSGHLTE
jgi:hypothetical protein